jgi:hypothetical protein
VSSSPVIDYTDLDYESLRAAMLNLARELLPEWTDLSENDPGVVLIELFAYACDITLYYQNRIALNLLPETSDEPKALAQLLRFIGYELRPATPATANLEVGFDATTPTPILLPAGTLFLVTVGNGQVPFETVDSISISSSDLSPPDAANVRRLFPVAVVQGQTVKDDAGTLSTGIPNQSYTLSRKQVLPDSIQISVTEPTGITSWRRVDTFAASTPADRHFVALQNPDSSVSVVFGDGTNGMIPPRGTQLAPAIITPTYRVGGGPQGNVAPASTFVSTLPSIRTATNPVAAAGGADAEDPTRARRFAPRLYRAQDRAVTLDDYVDLALQVPGVGKAYATALAWNQVALTIAPTGQVAPPSDLLKRDVLAYLERRRMATTSVIVVDPSPVDVFIGVSIIAQPYYRESEVRAAVTQSIAGYLAFDNVEFGQRIYLSRVYELIQDLPQVVALTVTEFRAKARGADVLIDSTGGIIALGPTQLPRPGYGSAILDIVAVAGAVPTPGP